jgi:hypothetical protein
VATQCISQLPKYSVIRSLANKTPQIIHLIFVKNRFRFLYFKAFFFEVFVPFPLLLVPFRLFLLGYYSSLDYETHYVSFFPLNNKFRLNSSTKSLFKSIFGLNKGFDYLEYDLETPIIRVQDGQPKRIMYENTNFSIRNQTLSKSEIKTIRDSLATLLQFKGLSQLEQLEEILLRLDK